jgi:riboflavin kinase
MDEILLLLLKKGAHKKPVKLTTAEVGEAAGMSQQSASRRLLSLEEDDMITKGPEGTALTKKAYDEIAREYAALRSVFEEKLDISGTVETGIGEGKYYLGLDGYRKQMKEKLGFTPFPGTLNIRLPKSERWKKEQLLATEAVVISGFRSKERTYGDIYAYPCELEGNRCAVIIPLRTSHGADIVEIACGFDIRGKLGKKDGDLVKVIF